MIWITFNWGLDIEYVAFQGACNQCKELIVKTETNRLNLELFKTSVQFNYNFSVWQVDNVNISAALSNYGKQITLIVDFH